MIDQATALLSVRQHVPEQNSWKIMQEEIGTLDVRAWKTLLQQARLAIVTRFGSFEVTHLGIGI